MLPALQGFSWDSEKVCQGHHWEGENSSHGAQTARLSCLPTWALRQLQRSLPPSSLGEIIGDLRLFHHLSPPRTVQLRALGALEPKGKRMPDVLQMSRSHIGTIRTASLGPPGREKRWADKPGSTEMGAFPGSYRASSSNRGLLTQATLKDPEAARLFVSYCLKGKTAEDPSLPVMTFPQPEATKWNRHFPCFISPER